MRDFLLGIFKKMYVGVFYTNTESHLGDTGGRIPTKTKEKGTREKLLLFL